MKYSKIYALAPYGKATGGIELAHQLVSYLRDEGQDAKIVYIEKGEIVPNALVTQEYEKYNICVANQIEDDGNNFLVLPETFYDFILIYKKIHIGCWWMSVNNRYLKTTFKEAFCFANTTQKKWNVIKSFIINKKLFCLNDNNLLRKEDGRIVHFYQSAYAQHHLYDLGFSYILPLSDYINNDLIRNQQQVREDLVLYNPKKGFVFTKKIIKRFEGSRVKFIALSGFNRKELSDLMNKAKLYIDFGDFPGKDRLPREAILNGCCILTGKLGAARFYEDVAIPSEYKIESKKENLPEIEQHIYHIMDHFEDCLKDMAIYKQHILMEKVIFYSEVDKFFL